MVDILIVTRLQHTCNFPAILIQTQQCYCAFNIFAFLIQKLTMLLCVQYFCLPDTDTNNVIARSILLPSWYRY